MKRWIAALTVTLVSVLALVVAAPMLEQATPLTLSWSRFADLPDLLRLPARPADGLAIGGQLRGVARHADGSLIATFQKHNYLPLVAENKLRDCFAGNSGTACTVVAGYKYHGIGTGNTAAAEGNTGCGTELTTEYTGNVRATGTQVNSTDRVYSTVATNTLDSGTNVAVTEFCLMDQAATGGGNIWSRVVFGAITLNSGDSLQTTYSLTIGGASS